MSEEMKNRHLFIQDGMREGAREQEEGGEDYKMLYYIM